MNIIRLLLFVFVSLLTSVGKAALIPIDQSSFDSGATVIDFSGLTTGTEANGLVVNGVTFGVTKGGVPTNGIVIVDAGPGVTNNIIPPNLVSLESSADIAVVISLSNFVTEFGYGYAVLNQTILPAATTVELFSGSTSLGTLAFTGVPDPTFTGGFAGVGSNLPFNRAVITFSNMADAFALDNVTFASAVSDQGQSFLCLFVGLLVLLCFRLHHQQC